MTPSADSSSGPGRSGQRHEQSLTTRAAIVAAAAERFAEVGYHGATLSEILSRSGVTKGAMYFHFPHKEAVADAVIAATNAAWAEVLAELEAPEWEPLRAVVVLTERVVDTVRHDAIVRGGVRLLNDAAVTVRHGAAHYRFVERVVASRLREAAATGSLRPGVDVAVLARQVATLMAGHNLICERSGTLDELPARVEAMWTALLPLIAAEDWIAQHPIRA
ncbi:ScbR family autoregulator-binding transcription factor [Actinomycetospora corticicola]|uniref:AcrR family transcriptional regulator n=1 Tax=Actinomycetospora corticicola TaxID=663602 RepID=A0A7Y9DXZ0_9PSEU|nr:AcrR family transcriptional regulator [Actinomycetospora corticicola]